MTRRPAPGVAALCLMCMIPTAAPATDVARGTVRVDTSDDAKNDVPDRYRLPATSFEFTLTPRFELRHSGVDVYDLTFPSPVKSAIPENNTVHAEYYVPQGVTGKVPAVIVLDILDGAAVIARGQAVWLAQNGVAALFVHMAHYGPRRPPGSKVRLLSTDVEGTKEAIRQTVLDCRCAAAWLAARPEIDADRLGVVGTSLGSFIGANVAAAEPRIKNVCLLLGGGNLVESFLDHPKAKPYAAAIDLLGGKDALQKMVAPVDPVTYAPQLKKKNLLLMAASRDDVVPPKAAVALWEATGKQKIVWFDATHVGAAVYMLPALQGIAEHVKK